MNAEDRRAEERLRMVAEQIEGRGVRGEDLLNALRETPRHRFVPEDQQRFSYQDGPLPIGNGQTISQPYIVALMTELLELTAAQRVLEIGTGSGYQAAILARLAAEVHTLERIPELANRAAALLVQLGCANVFVHAADGSDGWPSAAPYAGILVAAAAPAPPRALLEQLQPGGRLVLPVGGPGGQQLQRWTRRGSEFVLEEIAPVSFVPLRGAAGWSERDWKGEAGTGED